jgi:ADP-ribose pyrophosphatase YjhB (NUDIX family)
MAKRRSKRALQFGALPWRIGERGTREIMLLTSRETHRWIIPKGWPIKGRKPADVASQEAYEEAGLMGRIVSKRPLGNFHYEKRLAKKEILCEVRVFLFRVGRQLDHWPEEHARETRWFDATEAAELVEEGGLRKSSGALPAHTSGSLRTTTGRGWRASRDAHDESRQDGRSVLEQETNWGFLPSFQWRWLTALPGRTDWGVDADRKGGISPVPDT